jgi:lysophospholipase L1-like esterase
MSAAFSSIKTLPFIIVTAFCSCHSALAQATVAESGRVVDALDRLPRVLLIGDSIAADYAPAVQQALKYSARVVRGAGGTTENGLKEMDALLADGPWAVIHFNWGLHDLKIAGPNARNNIPIEQYGKNLRELVGKMQRSGATLIFATTTPVPQRVLITERRTEDAVLYNAVALKIMEENQIHIDDLHALIRPRIAEFQYPSDVHFSRAGSEFLGRGVAKSIESMLYFRKTLEWDKSR